MGLGVNSLHGISPIFATMMTHRSQPNRYLSHFLDMIKRYMLLLYDLRAFMSKTTSAPINREATKV